MQKKKQQILFVSHMADWSGAPLIFLGMIKEFKKQSGLPFRILIMQDGELTKEFRSAGRTYVWKKKTSAPPGSGAGSVISFFSKALQFVRGAYIFYRIRRTTLVFFNTISNGHIHKKLLFLKCKYVCYVHEMEAAIHILTNSNSLQVVLDNTHHFLAGSKAVKQNLVNSYSINSNKIDVVYSSIAEVSREKAGYASFITSFKTKNNIPPDAVIIGVAASNEWRKGFDLFFPLVSVFFSLYPQSNAYFIWKGFRERRNHLFYDLFDYKKFNTKNRIFLLPHGNDSLEHIACFDIHLLLSREDPYPLVVLEAASFAIPTVCFSDAGGTPEFVGDDCGYCVPYGDLLKMAERLNELVLHPDRRNRMGSIAREKVRMRHGQEKTTRQVIDILNNIE
jgi:glycosyltransferase involved in cell wall biosynthesis